MAYCPKCGIKVIDTATHCPLCKEELQAERPTIKRFFPEQVYHPAELPFDWQHLRNKLFIILSGGIGLALLLVMVIDLATGFFGWSRFVIVPLVASWGYLATLFFGFHKPARMLGGLITITFFQVLALDFLDGGITTSFEIGFPIAVAAGLFYCPYVSALLRRKLHWASAINWFLGASAGFCLVVDVASSWGLSREIMPGWSLVVGVILLPPICFLFYIRYRLVKLIDLEKFFHT